MTRPTPPYNRTGFHRLVRERAEWLANLQSVIELFEIRQSLIDGVVSRFATGNDWLRSAVGFAEPQTEGRRSCGPRECPLVTSARFAKQSARWSRRMGVAGCAPVQRSIEIRFGPAVSLLRNGNQNWLIFVTATECRALPRIELAAECQQRMRKNWRISRPPETGFRWWLRSAVGERGKWSGGRR